MRVLMEQNPATLRDQEQSIQVDTPDLKYIVRRNFNGCSMYGNIGEYDVIADLNSNKPQFSKDKFEKIIRNFDFDSLRYCIIEVSQLCLFNHLNLIQIKNIQIVLERHVINSVSEQSYMFEDIIEQVMYVLRLISEDEIMTCQKVEVGVNNLKVLRKTLQLLYQNPFS